LGQGGAALHRGRAFSGSCLFLPTFRQKLLLMAGAWGSGLVFCWVLGLFLFCFVLFFTAPTVHFCLKSRHRVKLRFFHLGYKKTKEKASKALRAGVFFPN